MASTMSEAYAMPLRCVAGIRSRSNGYVDDEVVGLLKNERQAKKLVNFSLGPSRPWDEGVHRPQCILEEQRIQHAVELFSTFVPAFISQDRQTPIFPNQPYK